MPALGSTVTVSPDRTGQGGFIGIVARRYADHCHVIIGATRR